MESCGHHASLPHQHRIAAALGQNFYAIADPFNTRRADENHLHRIDAELGDGFKNRRIDLTTVTVALDGNVNRVEPFLFGVRDLFREQDRAGARAEGRFSVDELVEFGEKVLTQQFQKCARLAAGDNKAINLVELLGLAHEYDGGAELFEPSPMRIEIPLQR